MATNVKMLTLTLKVDEKGATLHIIRGNIQRCKSAA